MYNPLNNHPRIRQALLDVQWVVNGLQVVLAAAFAFVFGPSPDTWPTWFVGSLVVAPVIWSYLGITARNNVTGTDAEGMPITTEEAP